MHGRLLLDDLPAAGLLCDPAGTIVDANSRAHALFGRRPVGLAVPELLVDGRSLVQRANGVPVTVEVATSDTAYGARLVQLTEVAGDRLVSEANQMLDVAFELVPLGMALYNTDGEFIRVNRAMCALLGRSKDDVLGRRDQELTHPDDRQADLDAAVGILAGTVNSFQCEKRFQRPDGGTSWALANLAFLRDAAGHPLCWVGTFQDITVRRRSEVRLRHLADHDPLTGVLNRRRLIADLETHLAHAGRANERGAVLVLDLDGFKAVNDTRGHEVGDDVLATVALAMRRRLRATDTLGRIGGDEFAAVLPHVDADGARTVADELREAVREAAPLGVTASCGIALYGPDQLDSADGLLASADRAMYAAKRGGRDAAVLAGR